MNSTTNTTSRLAAFAQRHRRWVILAMLLSLHAALIAVPGSDYQRIWLLVHFGLFLLWQPFVATDQEVKVFAVLLIFLITGVMLYFLSGWMITGWIAILIGILGGKVFTQQAARRSRFYLVAAFYLFAALLVWVVPVLLLGLSTVPEGTLVLVSVFLPLVLVLLLVLPFNAEDESSQQVFDFFYSLFVFQLVMALGLGSVALMRATQNDYYTAVLLMVLGFAGALFVLAVLWGPRTGFGGLRTYFSRYLMSVGMPFELWMRRIAELAETDPNSATFLASSMAETAKMPWVLGAEWKSPDGNGEFGDRTQHPAKFRYHDLQLTFFTEIRMSPALFLHVRLLAQVVGEFYEGKRREQALRQNAYLQAVHETGAALTHDIKNLLQSLFALTSANPARAADEGRSDDQRAPSAYEAMLGRQLPHLTRRLQSTLDKLQNPAVASHGVSLPAGVWWKDVMARYRDENIEMEKALGDEEIVALTLFDTVLENCLENARRKLNADDDGKVRVAVRLFEANGAPAISIEDSGEPIREEIVKELFVGAVSQPANGGLGIGLFQAARQAEQAGYALSLAENRKGCVRFLLKRSAGAQQQLAV
jgi:signal transduction histidine kinase